MPQLSDEIKATLAKRRRKAILLYIGFAIIQIALIVWLIFKFNIVTQFAVMFFEALLIAALIFLYKKSGIKGAFSKVYCGTVKDMKIYSEHKKAALYSPMTHIEVALLQVELESTVEEVRLPSVNHASIYKVGDRVYVCRAFKTPVLLSQDAERIACPICAAIFPTERGSRCPHCDTDCALIEEPAKK